MVVIANPLEVDEAIYKQQRDCHKITLQFFAMTLKLLLFISLPLFTVAQLDNSPFYDPNPIDSTEENQINFRFHNLNFTKNNEYFDKIADGYTLFGTQFSPEITFQPNKIIRISAGVFLQKDFGNIKLVKVEPLFHFKAQKNNHEFSFGNIVGHVNHRYIEPLYDFERVMSDRIESGFQYIYTTPNQFVDVWVNWERMQYNFDTNQEAVSGGISSTHNYINTDKYLVQIPLQLLLYHKGGQLDVNPDPLISFCNAATGLTFEYKINESSFLKSIRLDNYVTYYLDFSHDKRQPFNSGNGVFSNLTFKTKIQTVMISYWNGNRFISAHGGQLYPSFSRSIVNPDAIEPNRQLLIFRFMDDFKMIENVYLTTRFEPYFNLNNGEFNFSTGLFINYKQIIGIKKIKSKI